MMKHLLYIICLVGLITSCNLAEDVEYTDNEEVVLTFPISLSEGNIALATGVENSKLIRCIDLLVFDDAKRFIQRIKVNNILENTSNIAFKVRLAPSNKPRTIHVIANGRDENNIDIANFSSITDGLGEEQVISLLKTNAITSSQALKSPLLMSGKAELSNIQSNTTIGTVNLIRSVASIYVQCDTDLINSGDFVLTGFSLLKTAQQGQVIATNNGTVTLPSNLKFIDYTDANGSGVWGKAITNTLHTEMLYVYERSNVLDNSGLSVIVSGKYKGTEGYYKIWLQDERGNARNIVRNQCFQVHISRITSAGYASLSDAISASHPANIHANIIDNNDDITDIVVGGKYELGTSSNRIQITGNGHKVIGTILNTNLEVGVKATALADWITDLKLEGAGIRQTLTANLLPTTSYRKGVVVVRAGNLEKRIEITQLASASR